MRRGRKNKAEGGHPDEPDAKYQEVDDDDDPAGTTGATQATSGATGSGSSGGGIGGLTGLDGSGKDADVTELYSPERVTLMAPTYGLEPASAFDLTIGWDLSQSEVRKKCWRQMKRENPRVIIGSVMCTNWSQLMRITLPRMPLEEKQRRLGEAISHLEFLCKIYKWQARRGLYYIHEHPQQAESWTETCVMDLVQTTGGEKLLIHQCQ